MPQLLPQLLKLGVYFFTDFKHESLMFEGALGPELMYMAIWASGVDNEKGLVTRLKTLRCAHHMAYFA